MSEENTVAESKKRRISIPMKLVIVVFVLLLFWPALFGLYYIGYSAYRSIDQTRFPKVSSELVQDIQSLDQNPSEPQKGSVLAKSMYLQLERELDSTFGWSVNDLILMPTRYMDNRANRQRGVIFATRLLVTFFSTHMAKFGPADQENPYLKECREKHLVYGEDIWGFFRSSTEREYRKAIELIDEYRKDLLTGESVYNARTDDFYNVLEFIVSEEFLGNPMGLLVQTNETVDFTDLDDRIYYTQGIMLVVRDFLHALTSLYPSITQKGGEENIQIALRELDKLCAFDPLIVLRGDKDSLLADHRGKMAKYLITVTKRIEDVSESIRR